jgi:hypothetical protein
MYLTSDDPDDVVTKDYVDNNFLSNNDDINLSDFDINASTLNAVCYYLNSQGVKENAGGYIMLWATGNEADDNECLNIDSSNGSPRITGVGAPVYDYDVANKLYVDEAVKPYVISATYDENMIPVLDKEFDFLSLEEHIINGGTAILKVVDESRRDSIDIYYLRALDNDSGAITFYYMIGSSEMKVVGINYTGTVSCSIYTIQTDAELTQANTPADAKAVGDAFIEINEQLGSIDIALDNIIAIQETLINNAMAGADEDNENNSTPTVVMSGED